MRRRSSRCEARRTPWMPCTTGFGTSTIFVWTSCAGSSGATSTTTAAITTARVGKGFFEIAPGRLSVAGELSRPATADPWLLSRLIHELVSFFQIRPHSLHLSFQLRKSQIGHQRVLPLGFVQCLLALGGGARTTARRLVDFADLPGGNCSAHLW